MVPWVLGPNVKNKTVKTAGKHFNIIVGLSLAALASTTDEPVPLESTDVIRMLEKKEVQCLPYV